MLKIENCPLLAEENNKNPLNMIDVGAAGGVDDPWGRLTKKVNLNCYGFEAFPKNFHKLKSTKRIHYFPYAISDKMGTLEFFGCKTVGSLSARPDREERHNETYERIEVLSKTLESFRTSGEISSLDIIKTDTEGHELDVFNGAGEYLAKETLYVKTEFTFKPTDTCSLANQQQYLFQQGFTLHALNYNYSLAGGLGGGDALFLKDIGWLLSQNYSPESLKAKVLKLITVSILINHLRYAVTVSDMAFRAGILSYAESEEVKSFVESVTYLPDLIPRNLSSVWFSKLAFYLSQIFAGSVHHKQGVAKENVEHLGSRLWVPTRFLPGWLKKRAQAAWKDAIQTAQYQYKFTGVEG